MKEFISKVHFDNKYSNIPKEATFVIDQKKSDRIRELSKIVKENQLYKIVIFDYCVKWGSATSGDQIHIRSHEFWFSAYLRPSGLRIETRSFMITELP